MHVQMAVQGLGFKQSSDTFMPGSESEHRWQDEHPDGTFILIISAVQILVILWQR